MKTINYRFIIFCLTTLLIFEMIPFDQNKRNLKESQSKRIRSTSSPKASIEAKKGRWEYFHRMLRDPATGEIPRGIRQKELEFAETIQKNALSKNSNVNALEWKEAGPVDVGGRTRALAVDINDPNTIIAGGVTGGIWKSTDKGATWQMKSTTNQILGVSCIAQDPRTGNTNNWYYASGEFDGSGPDYGYTARFYGSGIYKSTDNGENWNLLTSANNPTSFDTEFDYVSKIIVHPTSGNIFAASHAYGIIKSSNGGASFDHILGTINDHKYADIVIASNGTLIAALSSGWNENPTSSPGIFKSTNDGVNWTDITPNNFPATAQRSVIASAQSNPNVAYVLTFTGNYLDQESKIEEIKFYKINVSSGSSEDRSDNLPNLDPQNNRGRINTQSNYNLVIAVKPDNEDFVMIGGTSLFKSEDGFATKPTDALKSWIGGYSYSQNHWPFYPNFHPDIHSFAFSPNNPNEMWWGHDGGLTYTDQLNNNTYTDRFPWTNMNNGYNVTQFYTVVIPETAGDNRIMGGTQDNGTPYFNFDGNNTSEYYDVSWADGAFCYFGKNYAYTSIQNGFAYRLDYDQNGNPYPPWVSDKFTVVSPAGATGQLFINPFSVDPTDENIMYYLAGNVVWRNNSLESIPYQNYDNTNQGWTELTNSRVPEGYYVTCINCSENNPSHTLYYGASGYQKLPKIYRLNNSNTSTNVPTDISVSAATEGAYVHNIAINPAEGNEIIVVFSNYNIPSLYHSSNGGQSYISIEGNLNGDQTNPGPSIRAATILPTSNGPLYLVGTSTGIYSTSQLNGTNTSWTLEGAETVGNVIVNSITSRPSDGKIVAGTHGRGAFEAYASGAGAAVAATNVNSLTLQSRPGQSGSTSFVLSNDGEATLNYNISVTGNFGSALPKYSETKYFLYNADVNSKQYDKFRREYRVKTSSSGTIGPLNKSSTSSKFIPSSITGNDILFLDDGDSGADDFIGYGDGTSMYWYNEFNVSGFSFELDAFQFYMQTENASSNDIYAAIYDQSSNLLSEGYLSLQTAPTGSWYEITLSPTLTFNDGETFIIEVGSDNFIFYPAGVDTDAQIKNKSFYYNWYTMNYDNLNTISGYENGAFLIRAVGTAGGGSGNQNPVAVANISKTQAEVNETITFDGSQSYDNDGNITQFLWNFGDGNTSTQATATHAYSQANTYNYSLTVTDNDGATDQKTGQITVSGASTNYVTVNPSNGSIQPGSSQTITLTLDAQNIQEGTYTGQVNISSNGGNITIPIDYLVDVEKLTEIPIEFSLSQNYPNPFNPSTSIEFAVPRETNVSIKIYDMLGKEVATLLNEVKKQGTYKVIFDASTLASGVYVYRIETSEFVDTKKLILLK